MGAQCRRAERGELITGGRMHRLALQVDPGRAAERDAGVRPPGARHLNVSDFLELTIEDGS